MVRFWGLRGGFLALIALLFLLVAAAAATPTPTPTPAGERCLRAGDLCLPETNFTINSVFDTALGVVKDWEKMSGKESAVSFTYGLLERYGITKEQFDKANPSKTVKPETILLVVSIFAAFFFLLFCTFNVRNPLEVFRGTSAEDSAGWQFMDAVREKIAPGWKLADILESKSDTSFYNRILAGLETPMYGRFLGELGKKAAGGFSSSEAADARSKLGGINAKLQGQAKNVIRATLMDVATMLTAARYAIPMMFLFIGAYWMIGSILTYFEFTKAWVPMIWLVYKMLAITFWAFWLWEIIRFTLIRSGFLFAMVFPISILKFLYIPFTGGGIKIVVRAFQLFGMMWLISAMKPAGMEPLSLVLGMTAAMTLYVLLVFIILIYGMGVSLAATAISAPFVAVVRLFKGLAGAAVTAPTAMKMPEPKLSQATFNVQGQPITFTKLPDGKVGATSPQGKYALWGSIGDVERWARSVGVNLGEFLGQESAPQGEGPKKGQSTFRKMFGQG